MTETHAPELPAAVVAGEALVRDEWLKVRRTGMGGSDIAGMLGLEGAYGTPVTVWQSKVDEPAEEASTMAMRTGNILEQPLADLFSEESGVATVQPPPITIYRSKDLPIALASPDRLAVTGDRATAFVEIKNAGAHKRNDWEEGPPLYYAVQCQWQLAVSGLDRCYLAALIGGTDFRYYVVEATSRQHEQMFAEAERFWHYVETNTPPPVDGSEKTRKALLAHYAKTVPEAVEGGEELALALRDYQAAKERESDAHKAVTLAQNRIAAIMREYEVGTVNGVEACRFPTLVRKGYTVAESTYRRLTVVSGFQESSAT